MSETIKPGAMVLVRWTDATGEGGWFSEEDVMAVQLPVAETVGFLVGTTDDAVIVAQSKGEHDERLSWGCPMHIPRGMVKSMNEVYLMAEASQSRTSGEPPKS